MKVSHAILPHPQEGERHRPGTCIFDSKGIEKARTLHNHTEYIIIEIECPKAAKAWLGFSCEKLVGRLVWEVSLLIASSPGGEDHCRCKVWAEGARTD